MCKVMYRVLCLISSRMDNVVFGLKAELSVVA